VSKPLHQTLVTLVDVISERAKNGGIDIVGMPTGFTDFDKATNGLRKRVTYYIVGRTGMGKTALALSMAYNIARDGKNVLMLSLEMDAELLALRTLAMHTGIPSGRIERGQLSKEELIKVQEVLEITERFNFNVVDDPLDSGTFIKSAKKYQDKHGMDILIVDYASLFRDELTSSENERLNTISKNLLTCAKECDIPVLALAQLNREVEKRENHVPILSDIRDSGSLEQDAFAVFACYRPHYYAQMFDGAPPLEVEDAEIKILKNRQGEVGTIRVLFKPEQTLWLPKTHEIKQPKRVQ
jgi:replicative DNA helicase